MNYILKPTLNHIATVKLATILWSQPDIRFAISKFSKLAIFEEKFLEIEDKVKKKVPLLTLPKLMREKLLAFIKPIGFQIFRWILYHRCSCLKMDLPQEFCWTSYGRIDCKRTAEILVKDESIVITKRYKLSCIYCLENSIRELWSQMHEDCRKGFDNPYQHKLVIHWTNVMKEEITSVSFSEDASFYGNAVAAKFFFEKLTPTDDRGEYLVRTAATVADSCAKFSSLPHGFIIGYSSETLVFLLSKMDKEQQMKLFEKVPLDVLICLLDWPWQFFWKETASVVMIFLNAELYKTFMIKIVESTLKCFNCQEIFGEIWQQSPDAYKRYVLNNDRTRSKLVTDLFSIKDKNNLKLIFHDATLLEKKKIIHSYDGRSICMSLMFDEEWSLLDFFIRECISSKDELIMFRVHFIKVFEHMVRGLATASKKDKLCKCSQLLNNILCDFDKRNEENFKETFCNSEVSNYLDYYRKVYKI